MSACIQGRAIIFDLDGTLVHSGPDLALATNRMLGEFDMAPFPERTIFAWLGNGARALVERALTGGQGGALEDALMRRGYELFCQFYSDGLCIQSAPYPGVKTVLSELRETGFRLGCVTNKPENFTTPLLTRLRLDRYFDLVVAGDSLPKKKPDPLPLQYVCRRFDAAHDTVIMVGDSISDIHAAQAAKMPVVCVSYGYNQGMDLTKARPDAIIDSFAELTDLVIYQC